MDIASIYGPVQADLDAVESNLKAQGNVDFPWMSGVVGHILKDSGKRVRPALTLLAGKFFTYDVKLLFPMATAVELLHTATLVHDDTIDNSEVRRGKRTINSLWGNSTAVLVGDYLFANAARLVSTTGNVRVMRLFAETLMLIAKGELLQTYAAYRANQSRQDYYNRIGHKTAALFSMATESGAILSGAPEEQIQNLKRYGYSVGLGFQIVDDIFDFIGDEKLLGKPVGGDLLHGTLTLPAIIYMERHPGDRLVEEVFARKCSCEAFEKLVQEVGSSGIVDECLKVAGQFCQEACDAVKDLPHGSANGALVGLAGYVLERKK